MIYPTVSELLACVDEALIEASDQAVPRKTVTSMLATCRHLIRHAELRARMEKAIFLDDIEKAGELLRGIAEYLQQSGGDRNGLASVIRAVLGEAPQLLTSGPDEIDRIRDRAKALRELVYAALKHLQAAASAERETAAYQEARRQLRDYMSYQIQQEARMIIPAFHGRGPRR